MSLAPIEVSPRHASADDSHLRDVNAALDRFQPIGLEAVNHAARLQTRKDRKYVLAARQAAEILRGLSGDVSVLEIDDRRWFGYESIYFDTSRFDSYRLAATRRPSRFKVRTRRYLDSGLCVAEVKTKDRRGRTVKHRLALDSGSGPASDDVRGFAIGFAEVAPYARHLEPVLVSTYQRATIALPADHVRVTLDAGYRCVDADGRTTGLETDLIIETKTAGRPSSVDRALWAAGHRPLKISKYATGLAAMHPELPANRWASVLRTHFGSPGTNDPASHPDGDIQ